MGWPSGFALRSRAFKDQKVLAYSDLFESSVVGIWGARRLDGKKRWVGFDGVGGMLDYTLFLVKGFFSFFPLQYHNQIPCCGLRCKPLCYGSYGSFSFGISDDNAVKTLHITNEENMDSWLSNRDSVPTERRERTNKVQKRSDRRNDSQNGSLCNSSQIKSLRWRPKLNEAMARYCYWSAVYCTRMWKWVCCASLPSISNPTQTRQPFAFPIVTPS